MKYFKPERITVTPEFAEWLEEQGLELVSIEDHGGGKATMTLGPIEENGIWFWRGVLAGVLRNRAESQAP